MKNTWILKNGATSTSYDSFPLAYRVMFTIAKKAVETKNSANVIKGLSIISPIKDVHGANRVYSYDAASKFATDTGLLTPEGIINSREFKRL
jgi:hypothetical protein